MIRHIVMKFYRMFDLELSGRRAEKTKDGILGNIHSNGVGGRKRAGRRAVEDYLENKENKECTLV